MIAYIHHHPKGVFAGQEVFLRQILQNMLRETQLRKMRFDLLYFPVPGGSCRLIVHGILPEEPITAAATEQHQRHEGDAQGFVREADRGGSDAVARLVQLPGKLQEASDDAYISDHQQNAQNQPAA